MLKHCKAELIVTSGKSRK